MNITKHNRPFLDGHLFIFGYSRSEFEAARFTPEDRLYLDHCFTGTTSDYLDALALIAFRIEEANGKASSDNA